jgi:hypothetical protein
MMAALRGRWSGTMIDTEGIKRRVELDLDEDDRAISGRVTLTVVSTDVPESKEGRLQGVMGYSDTGPRAEARSDNVQLIYQFDSGTELEFNGRYAAAGVHAEAAMFGTYRFLSQGDEQGSEGVAIFWRYREPLEQGG